MNRVWKFKCLIHLSDILKCDGQSLRDRVLGRDYFNSLTHKFPLKRPTRADFTLWDTAIHHITSPSLTYSPRLGHYIRKGRLQHHWYSSPDQPLLYYIEDPTNILDTYLVYTLDATSHNTRHGQRYLLFNTVEGSPPTTSLASTSYVTGTSSVSLHLTCLVAPAVATPSSFWDSLHSFENQTLWK